MSLTCSLLGHDWGRTEKETEYDERSEEIVITDREFKDCERCGERRVVSENTEVRIKSDARKESDRDSDDPEEEDTSETQTEEAQPVTEAETDEDETRETTPEDEKEPDESHDAAIIDEGGSEGATTATKDAEAEDALYTCPECSFSSDDPSLRSGDICPDCGGYLEEA